MKQIFIIAIFNILLFGCNTKENNINTSNLSNNLRNKPKLFLKFWLNMTKQEFDAVVKILIKDKVLEQDDNSSIYYGTPDCQTKLNPIFINDSLRGLELSEGNCFYELYKEKYHLPELNEEFVEDRRYVNENPRYNPSMSYISEKGVVKLPDFFKDKSTYSSVNQYLQSDKNGIKQKVLAKSPIVIKKGDYVIILTQTFDERASNITEYSLDLNPEIKKNSSRKSLSERTIDENYIKQMEYISKNSKYEILEIVSSSVIKIKYKSLLDYNQNVEKQFKREQNLKIKFQKREKERQNRKMSVKDEL